MIHLGRIGGGSRNVTTSRAVAAKAVPFFLPRPEKEVRCLNGHSGHYCFGDPANSESPVALRPLLARGLPLSTAYRA